ncbi:MAG: outer membrane protein transport protein [Pseudomonas marincola]|uniref:OmpP1/FadL family transporter n=1 Tax=Pseudomonas marincola TaxID=437900 RepID=UPI003002BA6D
MSNKILKSTLALAISAVSSYSMASGFAINEQSISSLGMSNAGRASSASDASTVYGNPAGMALIEREQVTAGAAVIFAKADITNASGFPGGSNDGDMVPTVAIPMGYYVKPIDENWAFGLGVYVPFGLATDYENGFAGRYYGDKSEVNVITIQPTVSYRFNDQLSIGFGPTINRIEGELTSEVPNLAPAGAPDGEVDIKGDDVGYGYNFGLMYEITPSTRLGVTYHSKVEYSLEGHTTVSGVGAVGTSAGRYGASLDVTTPEAVDFSLTHQLNNGWTVHAGATWTRWSRFDKLVVENDQVGGAYGGALTTITEEENWHDTWAVAAGAEYQLNKQWVLRTGIALDQAPTNNTDLSPRIPTGDRTIYSIGAGWSPNDDITVDVAYSYLNEEDVHIDRVSATKGSYSATYRNSAHALGAQVTYRF